MTTYNTYQEAKIANTEESIYTTKISMNGKREVFGVYDIIADITLNYYTCSPADYCMTVEKFLADGHNFVEGDVYLNIQGDVRVVSSNKEWIDVLNGKSAMDNKRYILRAEALEEKPTPTKFVKVEESIFDLKGEFELGELYCKNLCASDDYTKLNTEVALFGCAAAGNVYRKVEVDWVESVIGLAPVGYGIDRSFSHRLGIAGSYNKEQALTLANAIIASLTEKPE